jgi:hypothetical protein
VPALQCSAISSGWSWRTSPFGNSPSVRAPIPTRTSRSTSAPAASTIRLIWRLRPSSITISIQALRGA